MKDNKMLTSVYIIRHGQTTDSEEKRYKGHIDVPLSHEGKRQLERLARHLHNGAGMHGMSGSPLDMVFCSDLSRAVKSAEILASSFGLQPIVIKEFRERNFGKWEGMTFDEIQQTYPEEFKAWAHNPLRFSPIGGESTDDVKNRVMPVFDEILESNKGRKIAIVAHGGVNRVLICELLGIPLEYIFRVDQDFGAMNIIHFFDDMPIVKVLNFTPSP